MCYWKSDYLKHRWYLMPSKRFFFVCKQKRTFLINYCIFTCNPPGAILIGGSWLFHPRENLFAHRKFIGVLRFGPPRKFKPTLSTMLVGRGLMRAPESRTTIHRLTEETVRMAATVADVTLHYVHHSPLWPSGAELAAKCHMAGFQRLEGFRPERIQEGEERKDWIREEIKWSILSTQ